ncbi:MAG TPA: ATP-binding cassette domain-containing protein [Gammaproteobacteria bacterium]|jgi:ATP-binding cassette subfamily F protein 3|nr:ATP-binding cassette domain-containing protein [Gammaproteobacteria bacterium]
MITLKNLTIRRGPNVLLENVNWTIFARQRIGLIGANGSGKSTLFSLMLGQYHADAGDLDIPRQLRLAHVSQETPAIQKTALDFVLDGDVELRKLEAELQKAEDADDGMRIAELHEKMGLLDAYTAPARAGQLLSGLGFNTDEQKKLVSDFSGGWRVRLNLAKALMMPSDMLLLDEPTNHLDLDAILWLEEWLKKYPGTLLIISHDRDFLDNIVDHIAKIDHRNLKMYTGNYSSFETLRASELMLQQAHYEKQQKKIAHMRDFVERFRYKATKARQAQSRLKAIERIELVSAVQSETPFSFGFPDPGNIPNPLLTLNHADVGYGERVIIKNLNFSITPKDRIAILGPNGAGKSTLIKMLAQEMAPLDGECITASGTRIGYFAQHQVEHLDLQASPLTHLRRISERATELELRTFLGSFGFPGDTVLAPVGTFSGGEKSRLALALIVWKKPNLLLLDEPTNHLDLEMRNALSLALTEYAGAMILISHDRFLVRSTTDQLLLCADGKLQDFDGDLNDYQKWLFDYCKAKNAESAPSVNIKKEQRRQSAQERETMKPVSDKIKRLEKEMEKLQKEAARLEAVLTDQSLYEDSQKDKLKEHLLSLSQTKASLEKVELEWLEASEGG